MSATIAFEITLVVFAGICLPRLLDVAGRAVVRWRKARQLDALARNVYGANRLDASSPGVEPTWYPPTPPRARPIRVELLSDEPGAKPVPFTGATWPSIGDQIAAWCRRQNP